MKKYRITTMNDATYTVTMDDHGVVDVDGLLPTGSKLLKSSVERGVKFFGLTPLRALGRAIGPYATAVEVDAETSVSDLL